MRLPIKRFAMRCSIASGDFGTERRLLLTLDQSSQGSVPKITPHCFRSDVDSLSWPIKTKKKSTAAKSGNPLSCRESLHAGTFHVEYGEKIKDVVQRMKIIRSRGVKVRYLLLDKGFFSVEVITYLKRAQLGFIIPAMVRGRKPKGRKKATGLRAIRKKKNGYYHHTLKGKVGGKQRSSPVTICVASKSYTHKKTGKRRTKKLMYVVSKVRLTPREIREMYRTRFGIETSYRQMHEARIKTCTRDPRLRLLFIGIALVLRNVWVWLHFKLAKRKWSEEPQLFLELLRFREMLLWIAQGVGRILRADEKKGIEYEEYRRLTENY